jgi:energy-coupling factor transport system ATP-binding protein
MIDLRSITFTYDEASKPALRDLSLHVPRGQLCALLGRSGAGKSTLCALLGGFIPQFFSGRLEGEALVDGEPVAERRPSDLAGRVALVTSDTFSQISGTRFTVSEEIAFGLENLGYPREQIVERVEWALAELDLQGLRDRSPYALSGGQQQRLVLAAAMALRPAALVLDEPTSALDPTAAAALGTLLRRLADEGTTIMVAEQRLDWAAGVADRVVALDEGALLADGPPAQVLSDPRLQERGVGWPRVTIIAAAARDAAAWPAARLLPVTVEQWPGQASRPQTADRRPQTAEAQQASAISAVGGRELSAVDGRERSDQSLVHVDNVTFRYPGGVEALRGVSLRLGAGERVAILGRNGAGKSTLVRHLNGLLRPSAGKVVYGGGGGERDIRRSTVAQCARHVGIVFQDVRNQLFARTVRDELRFGPRNLRYPAERVDALVERALKALDLRAVAEEHPYDLPPAQRRLVAVAAVLANDAPVLVLDEPTAGLDAPAIALLVQLAHAEAAAGRCVVVISHDMDFCADAAERVVLMQGGKIAIDAPWRMLDGPAAALIDEQVDLPTPARLSHHLGLPLAWSDEEVVRNIKGNENKALFPRGEEGQGRGL